MGRVITIAVSGSLALLFLQAEPVRGQQPQRLSVSESVEAVERIQEGGSKNLLRELALAAIPETY